MKKLLKILQYIVFLAIGVLIFWLFYKEQDFGKYKEQLLHDINYWWVALSFLLGIFSHLSRVIRWNMLLKPMGYSPKTSNTFISILVMYLINFFIPRGGEVARCGVLAHYEKIPMSKSFGTVIVERVSDFVALLVFAPIIFISQAGVIGDIFDSPQFQAEMGEYKLTTPMYIAGGVIVLLVILYFVFRKAINRKFGGKLKELRQNLVEGIRTIKSLKNTWAYIGHTIFIYIMWLVALYMLFFAFNPTSSLGLMPAAFTFIMSGFAMVLPIQAGMGAWHFMVASTLAFAYGLNFETDAKFFAFMAHSSTNLFLIIIGALSLVALPMLNSKYKPDHEGEDAKGVDLKDIAKKV